MPLSVISLSARRRSAIVCAAQHSDKTGQESAHAGIRPVTSSIWPAHVWRVACVTPIDTLNGHLSTARRAEIGASARDVSLLCAECISHRYKHTMRAGVVISSLSQSPGATGNPGEPVSLFVVDRPSTLQRRLSHHLVKRKPVKARYCCGRIG